MQLSPLLSLIAAAVAGSPSLPVAPRARGSLRSRRKAEAYKDYLAVCKAQREQEQAWRAGGRRPQWFRPHASARSTDGRRWSKALNCWLVPMERGQWEGYRIVLEASA